MLVNLATFRNKSIPQRWCGLVPDVISLYRIAVHVVDQNFSFRKMSRAEKKSMMPLTPILVS